MTATKLPTWIQCSSAFQLFSFLESFSLWSLVKSGAINIFLALMISDFIVLNFESIFNTFCLS